MRLRHIRSEANPFAVATIAGLIATVVGGLILAVILGTSGGPGHSGASGQGPGPLPPLPKRTFAETPGGTAHTWANYTTAVGSEGPMIPAHQTVKIACRVTGYRVADGDRWWYRIASRPWSGKYFVSADAFYNNGRTTGPLHGTPFMDTRVPIC